MTSPHAVTFRLGLLDLLQHLRLALTMSMVIAVAVGVFSLLVVYRSGLMAEFDRLAPDLLVVQESQSFGEIYGSRLPREVGDQLQRMGVSLIAPEIHEVTGTSAKNATLLRGLDLALYPRIEEFEMISGRMLSPSEVARLAMIGSRLASNQKIEVGQPINLRGREFTVVGIFHTGTYMDNEAWIALEEAQALLGWGEDVSVFIIPDEGILGEGQALRPGVSVSRKGERVRFAAQQFQPVIDVMGVVAMALGIATALAIANILGRLAWLRRRQLAILRSCGFPSASLATYLLAQASAVTAGGVTIGGLLTWLLASAVRLAAFGFTIHPRLEAETVLIILGWTALLTLTGCLLPIWWLGRSSLARMLHTE